MAANGEVVRVPMSALDDVSPLYAEKVALRVPAPALLHARSPNRSNRYASSGPPLPSYASRAMTSEKGSV